MEERSCQEAAGDRLGGPAPLAEGPRRPRGRLVRTSPVETGVCHCSLETYGERDAARPHPARPTQQLPRAPVAGPWRTSRREAPLTTLMGQEVENEATRRGNT